MIRFRGLLQGLTFIGAGALFIPFFPACSSPPPVDWVVPQPTQSEVYNYVAILGPANATLVKGSNYYLLQPGVQIEIIRQPVAYGVGERAVIFFAEKLIGPFPSLEAAQPVPSDQFESASPVVASTLPYHIENWIKVTRISTLQLPLHHEEGYYWLLEKVCHQGETNNFCAEGGTILSIS
ncbi:MAG TPA: hypothetical protein VH599_00310 [Ktedonobacterales bacterium]|jgi:hypothetical protein